MTKFNKVSYKLLYYFLVTIPQFVAVIFSFSVTRNIMALFQKSAETNQLYFLSLGVAIIWAILIIAFEKLGVFHKMGITFNDFKADVLYIFGRMIWVTALVTLIIDFL